MPHPSGRAAMRMLEAEGFSYEGYLDIFDGGPTMTAATDAVKSIAAAKPATVTGTDCGKGQKVILAAGHLADFHACYGACEAVDGGIALDPQAADLLGVGVGDEVWWVAR